MRTIAKNESCPTSISVGWIVIVLLLLFNICNGNSQSVKDKIPSEIRVNINDVSRAYITVGGIYKKTNTKKYSSICIPYSKFRPYRYLTVKANNEYATRIHILKEVPQKQNEPVMYSDYYRESFLVRKGIKLDIVIPKDAKYIVILNSTEGNNNTPDFVTLSSSDFLCNAMDHPKQDRAKSSYKFLHWNIGHFSNGQNPYSIITEENYKVRLDGFRRFFDTYGQDCNFLLNEYDETFATINGNPISTADILFEGRKPYYEFPRNGSSAFNKLAVFWKDGLVDYKYGIFESLKGVKNINGTLQYGIGYCISEYSFGDDTLHVMSLHVPNKIKRNEHEAVYREILSICSGYGNCVLVGDFNRASATNFSILTDAGFSILNDNSVTYPSKDYILDWVFYRCHDVSLSDFKVYTEAVDSNGDLLSDHLPLSFSVTYNGH